MSGAARPGGTERGSAGPVLSGVRWDGAVLPVQAGQADARVDPAALDGRRYLASLLAEGLRTGLLTESDAGRVRDESLLLLHEQAERWTDGRCGSIRAENAQALLESVFYAAGVSLRTRGTPEAAIAALRDTPLRELYEAGQAALRRKLPVARTLHRLLAARLFRTPNVFYRATLVDGIAGFFRLYRPDFFAQETHITADYPLLCGLPALCGLEFVEQYLRDAAKENRFLLCFEAAEVDWLLFEEDCGYRLAPVNLARPVLAAAIGCALTGTPVRKLRPDRERAARRWRDTPPERRAALLSGALDQIAAETGCSGEVVRYLAPALPEAGRLLADAEARLI